MQRGPGLRQSRRGKKGQRKDRRKDRTCNAKEKGQDMQRKAISDRERCRRLCGKNEARVYLNPVAANSRTDSYNPNDPIRRTPRDGRNFTAQGRARRRQKDSQSRDDCSVASRSGRVASTQIRHAAQSQAVTDLLQSLLGWPRRTGRAVGLLAVSSTAPAKFRLRSRVDPGPRPLRARSLPCLGGRADR